jgi:hypothetical protein
MTHRKSTLWLHPPKRKSFSTKGTPIKRQRKTSQNKRTCTPLQRIPKRLCADISCAIVGDDKQSVPNAWTNFPEEDEKLMFENSYDASAKLTSLIRYWYDASDSPGISAVDRIDKLLNMRKFLLNYVDFGKFPHLDDI